MLLFQLLVAAAVIPRPAGAQAASYQEPGKLGDPASWRTPEFISEWGLGAMHAEYAYAAGFTGKNISIGVLDSGYYAQHPELSASRFVPVTAGGVSGVLNQKNNNHGTLVSGVIGGARDGVGMHGVAPDAMVYEGNTNATDGFLFGVSDPKFPTSNAKYFADVYDALAAKGVRVISNSWGSQPGNENYSTLATITDAYKLHEAVRIQTGQGTWLDAAAKVSRDGVINNFSAGNTGYGNASLRGSYAYFHPELEGHWMTTTGYDQQSGQVYNKCGIAKWWCVMAPTGVPSTSYSGSSAAPTGATYANFNGTSAAAPHASAALALIMERFPYMTSEQALSVMFTTAQNMEPDPSRPDYTSNNSLYSPVHPAKPGTSNVPNEFGGWGLVDLRKAMNGPGQLLGTFRVALPSGVTDVWSNDISDVALAARKVEDDAEHRAWLDTLKAKGWEQGLPAGASDGDKVDYATGVTREAAYQAREYQGSLVKVGGGTLTLAGANTYRGLTTVDGGELRIDGSIASGAIVNAAGRLTVNGRATDIAVNGGVATIAGTSARLSIDQAGAVAVTSTGTTGDVLLTNGVAALGGVSSNVNVKPLGVAAITGRTGNVVVDGGRASLDGASGDVSVANGGLVNGNGAMRSLSAVAGGTVAPGHSVGALSVAGDVSFAAGSTYAVELSPSGASDRIDAGGKALVAGGALSLALENAPPPLNLEQSRSVLGRRFVILNAAGGVEGQFVAPGGYLFVSPAVVYGPTSVSLVVNRNATPFASVARTNNERSVANALETLNPGSVVYNSVLFATSAQVPQATLAQLTGEIYPAAYATLINESRQVRDAVLDRLATIRDTAESRPGVWARLLGSWGSARGDGVNGYTSSTGGFLAGADAAVRDGVRVGGLAGYSHSGVSLRDQPSSGSFDSFHLGAYAAWQPNAFGLRAGVVHAWHRGGVDRYVQYGATPEYETGTLNAETTQVFTETAYRLEIGGAAEIEPFGRFAYVHLNNHGMTETGGAAAVRVQEGNNDVSFSTLGVRGTTQFALTSVMQLTLQGSVGWQHALSSGRPIATLAFASGSNSFTVASVPVAKDTAVVNLNAGFTFGKGGRASIGYSGALASRQSDHAVQGNLSWKF
ncbi:autotransporter domain-containing protein [Burkholderia sp. TSV86]|uniref:autotransporter domain-containing protein n=1 Tax=Burkholderia sp. TSV86 TaxID=1385594 RepID=UPI0007588F0F|nr:autotransporter domain-containing protein [Burkholderia sp. TSV86]KVE31729.1 peptidase S8 [Burkholderia sp. TSV86]